MTTACPQKPSRSMMCSGCGVSGKPGAPIPDPGHLIPRAIVYSAIALPSATPSRISLARPVVGVSLILHVRHTPDERGTLRRIWRARCWAEVEPRAPRRRDALFDRNDDPLAQVWRG